jgi:DNA-binding MarR family transcriptional regulator
MALTQTKKMPGHLIRRVHQISNAIFSEEMAAYDLTAVQFIALVAIGDHPDLDATRLSELIDFDRSTIGGVIERLEHKRLIKRAVSPKDRRIKTLRLTPAGRALVSVSFDRVVRVQDRLQEALSPGEADTFCRLLERIILANSGMTDGRF